MPYKNGIVVKIEENGWVEVVTDKLDACADCVSASNCPPDCISAKMVTRVRDNIGTAMGDTVSIFISRPSMLKSTFFLYTVPVVFLLIGVGIGSTLAPRLGLGSSSAALLIGLVGLCFGYFLVKAFSMRLSGESGVFPKIDRILHREAAAAKTEASSPDAGRENPIAGWQENVNNGSSSHRHFG